MYFMEALLRSLEDTYVYTTHDGAGDNLKQVSTLIQRSHSLSPSLNLPVQFCLAVEF